MLRWTLAIVITLGILGYALTALSADKVIICHKNADGSFSTIEVDDSAIPGHLGHGDCLGACTASPCQ